MTEQFVIKVINGSIVDHPFLFDNLAEQFLGIDIDHLPEPYVKFHRIPPPVLGHYEKNLRTEYQLLADGTVTDNWVADAMTPQERQDKINIFKQQNVPPYPSWRFNEDTMLYEAPVRPPIDEILAFLAANPGTPRPDVVWDENQQQWNVIYNNV